MIKKLLISLTILFALIMGSTPALVGATTKSEIQCGANQAAGADCSNAAPPSTLNDLIKEVINIISVLAGAAAVIMLIVGGFRFVTSGGSDTAVAGARKTILYAVVGIAVVAVAQVIVHFVLNNIG